MVLEETVEGGARPRHLMMAKALGKGRVGNILNVNVTHYLTVVHGLIEIA